MTVVARAAQALGAGVATLINLKNALFAQI
jgi:hypothetical protein